MIDSKFSAFPELTTKRLLLREINVTDATLIHELRSDQVTNTLIGRKNSNGVGEALLYIETIKTNVRKNESVYWVICFDNAPELIGTICFWNFDLSRETAELGYELLPSHRGQGIMSEVLPRVIQFGFEVMKIKQITAFTSEQNTGSVKLLEKFGFTLSSLHFDNTHEQVPGMATFTLDNPLTL
jgi:[ribosomal protein S5]-alanine N-acetyltransferase